MTANPLNNEIFQDATKARTWLESLLWADGRVCGYCGTVDASTPLKGKDGFYQCNSCRKQFTVMVGTVFERSHIPLNKWLMAAFLLCASKKGISAHQMHRMLGITYKSAWFMMHRLREALVPAKPGPLGGEGKIVEADETYIGTRDGTNWQEKRGGRNKRAVLALVERDGKARSFHIHGNPTKEQIHAALHTTVDRKSYLMTDEASWYQKDLGMKHSAVNHGEKEYARGIVSTNTVEGFFSIFKRGFKGVYQHCGEQHLQRYLAEYDFRYNHRSALGVEDAERTAVALKGIQGKRLTYRRTNEAQVS